MTARTAETCVPQAAWPVLEDCFGPEWRNARAVLMPGSTNTVVRLELGADAFAVRVPRADAATAALDRSSERRILQAAAEADVGPQLLAWQDASGVLVTRWIEGTVWHALRHAEPTTLHEMAGVFRRLHAIAPPADIRRIELAPIIESYLQAIAAIAAPPAGASDAVTAVHGAGGGVAGYLATWASRAASLRSRALEICAGLHRSAPALTHNDAHGGNIVRGDNGRLYLLDWEYAGLGDPMFDLAGFACYQVLDDPQRTSLLRSYGAKAAQISGFRAWCWIFEYIWFLWLIATPIRGFPGPRPDQINSAEHLHRLSDRLHRPLRNWT